MLLVLIAGGPCSGKTTLVTKLYDRLVSEGYRVYIIRDWAREIIRVEKAKGDRGILPWTNRKMFEYLVVKYHLDEYIRLLNSREYDIVLEDGGGFAAKAYCLVDNIDLPENYSRLLQYKDVVSLVFLMDYPREYFTDNERWEEPEYARRIHEMIHRVHEELFNGKVVRLKYTENIEDKVEIAYNVLKKMLMKISSVKEKDYIKTINYLSIQHP